MENEIWKSQLEHVRDLVREFVELNPYLLTSYDPKIGYPYDNLDELRYKVELYAAQIDQGVKDPGIEGEIAALEDYFSNLLNERIEIDLPALQ